ncbi:hypothetical protein K1719_003798 [Acacia pycnantha]|nr:hypothetical protein K1719_003798 [Acacia pycnantha]
MALRFPRFSQGLAQNPTTRRIWFGIATAHDFKSHDDITEEQERRLFQAQIQMQRREPRIKQRIPLVLTQQRSPEAQPGAQPIDSVVYLDSVDAVKAPVACFSFD